MTGDRDGDAFFPHLLEIGCTFGVDPYIYGYKAPELRRIHYFYFVEQPLKTHMEPLQKLLKEVELREDALKAFNDYPKLNEIRFSVTYPNWNRHCLVGRI